MSKTILRGELSGYGYVPPDSWMAKPTDAEDAAGVTVVDYQYEPGNVLRYGTNTSPGTTDMYPAISAAIASLPAPGGGEVIFPDSNNYYCSVGLAWSDRCVHLRGQGAGVQPGTGTRITFPAGVVGINPQNGTGGYGARSSIKHLRLIGSDVALGTNDGILLQCNSGVLEDVIVEGFGRHGVHVLSALSIADVSINANTWRASGVRVADNYGDGWKTRGVDSNSGIGISIDSSSNGGWGFYDDAFLGNTYITPHENGANASGAYRCGANGRSTHIFAGYKEDSATICVQIDSGNGGNNNLDFAMLTGTVADNTTAKANRITVSKGSNVLSNKIAVGDSATTVLLQDSLVLLDTGSVLNIKNAAQDAIWVINCLADKRLSISSAQLGPLAVGNQLQLPAGTTSLSSLRVPHGSAPASPVDGDMWTTTAGLYVRINGVTVGPLS